MNMLQKLEEFFYRVLTFPPHLYWNPLTKTSLHSNLTGQIALPGGAKEKGEELDYTAVREASEEVGIEVQSVEIIVAISHPS